MATMPVYNMTDLWNSGGTTYDAIKMNVTDSASAAASRLMTLQVGAVDKSYITKAGLGYFAGGLLLAAATALTFGSSDVAVTHSTDLLAFSGAASGYTFDNKLVVGHTANLSIGGNADNFEVFGTTAATGGIAIGMFNATAGTGPHLDFYRSKNASIGSATVVASGDLLGALNAYGAQQTSTFATQTMAAQIRFEVDGTVTSGGSGDMPGRIVLATTADGGSSVTDRVTINSAGLVTLAAGQVAFPASQNASSDANTLDDYEEGTFTPVIKGGTVVGAGTYTVQTGQYTKIGNMVAFTINLGWSAHTGTGTMFIDGLPFTAGSNDCPCSNIYSGLTYSSPPITRVVGSTTTVLITFAATTAVAAAIAIDTAASFYVSGIYFV